MIECPGACNIVVDDQTVMTLITDPRVKLKYQHLITNSFVQCNRLLRWCPSPDCSNAIKVQVLQQKPTFILCNKETDIKKMVYTMIIFSTWKHVPSSAGAHMFFASNAVKIGMIQSDATLLKNGLRSVMMIVKPATGYLPIPRSVQR